MALRRRDIAKFFRETADQYLTDQRPKYRNSKLDLSERELQKRFAMRLLDENIPFVRERYYPDQKDKKIDFKIFDVLEMHAEIEWEAANTDGFAKRTFEDMEKLDNLPPGHWGMFLALNVGDKYFRPKSMKWCHDPSVFALSPSTGKSTVLWRKWRESKDGDLLRCNPCFWYWPTRIQSERQTVTVLSCYGRRVGKGWKAN